MEEEVYEEVYEVELIYNYFFQHLRLSKFLIVLVSQKFGKPVGEPVVIYKGLFPYFNPGGGPWGSRW
jgi:hypothetical protein